MKKSDSPGALRKSAEQGIERLRESRRQAPADIGRRLRKGGARHEPAGNYAWVLLDPEMQSFMAATGWQVLTPPEQIAGMYDHAKWLIEKNRKAVEIMAQLLLEQESIDADEIADIMSRARVA